ncbi:MAG TPA: hypothetical protein VK255_01270, partial [Patescibacteria group bacterium]|nr:hypothetical protein [Patescibacteria group bacterium]
IAKLNAKKNKVGKKLKFIKSDLLKKFLRHTGNKMRDNIIIANLPYLSKKIYSQTPPDVKNFEPKSALLSGKHGLDHYEKLFIQMKSLKDKNSKLKAFLEISPEQKTIINRLIKNHFPQAQISYKKDLSGKWRMVKILL